MYNIVQILWDIIFYLQNAAYNDDARYEYTLAFNEMQVSQISGYNQSLPIYGSSNLDEKFTVI